MSPYQILKQARRLLQEREWENDALKEKVFPTASVRITPAQTVTAVGIKAFPICLINLGGMTPDPEASQVPGYIAQDLEIILGVIQPNDELGESSVVGAQKMSGVSSSKGRGLAEIERELEATLQLLTKTNGVEVQGFSASAIAAAFIEGVGFGAERKYVFRVLCSTQDAWTPPVALSASGGVGSISASWTAAPTRWDSIGQVIVRKSGAVAPTSITDGTALALAVGDTSEVLSGVAPGVWSISVFASYDELGLGSAQRYSPPVSYLSITVT